MSSLSHQSFCYLWACQFLFPNNIPHSCWFQALVNVSHMSLIFASFTSLVHHWRLQTHRLKCFKAQVEAEGCSGCTKHTWVITNTSEAKCPKHYGAMTWDKALCIKSVEELKPENIHFVCQFIFLPNIMEHAAFFWQILQLKNRIVHIGANEKKSVVDCQ